MEAEQPAGPGEDDWEFELELGFQIWELRACRLGVALPSIINACFALLVDVACRKKKISPNLFPVHQSSPGPDQRSRNGITWTEDRTEVSRFGPVLILVRSPTKY